MKIKDYRFGRIVIDGKTYTSDVIIFPDHVKGNWWRREGHRLHPGDLGDVIQAEPEVLVVGTGHSGLMRVLPETEKHLKEQGIELRAERTAAACQTYNRLIQSGRKAVAALHLTC